MGVLIASRCSLCLCLLGLGKATFDCFLTVLVDLLERRDNVLSNDVVEDQESDEGNDNFPDVGNQGFEVASAPPSLAR